MQTQLSKFEQYPRRDQVSDVLISQNMRTVDRSSDWLIVNLGSEIIQSLAFPAE